jgi:hypothetical protein
MKLRINTLTGALALLLLAASAGTASATQSAPLPGFQPGTWVGTGEGAAETGFDGDLITSMSVTATFTLTVSRDGKVAGSGTWRTLETGAGSVGAKITGIARVSFSGTPTDVRYAGTQVVTTGFVDAAHKKGTTFTRKVSGKLTIKKALSCRVTGGHRIAGALGPWVVFRWKATLKGVNCR